MKQLTVLTPTYNRAELLELLYNSLCNQSCYEFDWLVVDDGSTDNTKIIVEQWRQKSPFEISLISKENGGKHTALNAGIKSIQTELTFIVDSDDILTPNAVEIILRYQDKYKDFTGICGYSFLRIFPDGNVNGKEFPKNEWVTSLIEARINNNDANADKAEVYYTRVLKEYPFPEYPGEKFLGEDIVWVKMAKKYNMVHINEKIYIGNYLEEGLTSNRRIHNILSPVGCMNRAKEYLMSDVKFRYKTKNMIQYIVYGKFAKVPIIGLIKDIDQKILFLLVLIPALFVYCKWKRTYVL